MNLDGPVAWRFATVREMDGWRSGGGEGWLSNAELRELTRVRDVNRRRVWLLARILAKQLVLEHWHVRVGDPRDIEIISVDRHGRRSRPVVTVAGQEAMWSLSLSHTDTAALAAICTAVGAAVGVDLVRTAAVHPALLRFWFDAAERALAAADDVLAASRLWAVKEAVYKAVNENDPFAPLQVRVRQAGCGGYRCVYRGVDLADCCRIQTWRCGDHVAALAAASREALSLSTNKSLDARRTDCQSVLQLRTDCQSVLQLGTDCQSVLQPNRQPSFSDSGFVSQKENP